jgi:hypothetical protein
MKALLRTSHSILLLTTLIIAGGCSEFGLVHRRPLTVTPLQTSLAPRPDRILVQFDSVLPGVPLSETVWDNIHGPFANAEESKQIGFSVGWSPAIGMAVNLAPNGSRIVIPFGRILHEVLDSGLRQEFPNAVLPSEYSLGPEQPGTFTADHTVTIAVRQFEVWEQPLNHINLRAAVRCTVSQAGRTDNPTIYDINHEVTKQSLGSVLKTSTALIKEMNRISNEFAAAISEDALGKLATTVD